MPELPSTEIPPDVSMRQAAHTVLADQRVLLLSA